MASYHGDDGVIEVEGTAPIEVRSFSVTETIDTARSSVKGATSHTHKTGKKSWTGNLSCWHDPDDTNGQAVLVIGASVELTLYPTGDGAGQEELTGTATVTSKPVESPEDGMATVSFDFEGNGDLVHGVVGA